MSSVAEIFSIFARDSNDSGKNFRAHQCCKPGMCSSCTAAAGEGMLAGNDGICGVLKVPFATQSSQHGLFGDLKGFLQKNSQKVHYDDLGYLGGSLPYFFVFNSIWRERIQF